MRISLGLRAEKTPDEEWRDFLRESIRQHTGKKLKHLGNFAFV